MTDLRRLSTFVAIVEEGHVTRAAERIGMHLPALSRILRGLEVELQVNAPSYMAACGPWGCRRLAWGRLSDGKYPADAPYAESI